MVILKNIFSIPDSAISGSQKCQVLYYENFDLDNMVTPVDANKFDNLLRIANYDRKKCEFLHKGFTSGFSLGYNNQNPVQIKSQNLKLRVGHEIEVWNKVMKEIKLLRYAGPFSEIPFKEDYIQSLIGLVPKDGGKDTRLMFHLLYP